MATLQNSTEPEALAYTMKHFAFTRCGEWNAFGIVDAQIAVIEGQLLPGSVMPNSKLFGRGLTQIRSAFVREDLRLKNERNNMTENKSKDLPAFRSVNELIAFF